MFLYRNKDSIVLGRNQNPTKEINWNLLLRNNVSLARRTSGGGCVYHDMGNTNYCHIMPRDEFNRSTSVSLVSKALNSLNIPTVVNGRHDIVLDGKKVSGSAFKLTSTKALHHGTMLIDTDLDNLFAYLNPLALNVKGLGTDSVRSFVVNLRQYSSLIDHSSFCNAVITTFKLKYGDGVELQNREKLDIIASENEIIHVDENSIGNEIDPKEFDGIYQQLQSKQWIIGQTPKFTLELKLVFGDIVFWFNDSLWS